MEALAPPCTAGCGEPPAAPASNEAIKDLEVNAYVVYISSPLATYKPSTCLCSKGS